MTSAKGKVVQPPVADVTPAVPDVAADRFSALLAAISRWLRPADGVEIVSIDERDNGLEAVVVLRRLPEPNAAARGS
ncbi:MAG: hypothetical protein JSS35_07155 [Proteobacteria bacterium]|nr:hypothetical protein [Pseudomonadota bacterium]